MTDKERLLWKLLDRVQTNRIRMLKAELKRERERHLETVEKCP